MKTFLTLATIAAVALAFTGIAFAADGPVTATGKIAVKDKVSSLAVTQATGADGKVQADLAGKTLKIVGAKAAEAEKLAGKTVEVKGTVKGADIDASAIGEKAAPAVAAAPVAPVAPAAPAAPAAPVAPAASAAPATPAAPAAPATPAAPAAPAKK